MSWLKKETDIEIIDIVDVYLRQREIIGELQLCKKPVEKGSDVYEYSLRLNTPEIKLKDYAAPYDTINAIILYGNDTISIT